jgi:hypothetical protein
MPSERTRQAHLNRVVGLEGSHGTTYGFTASLVPATGPHASGTDRTRPEPLSSRYAAVPSRPQRNVVPSTHIR